MPAFLSGEEKESIVISSLTRACINRHWYVFVITGVTII